MEKLLNEKLHNLWPLRNILKLNSVALVSKQTNRPSGRRLSGNLVPTFMDRGCRMVSATDPHDFLDPKPLLFH
jgi:hypothetical protein